MTALKDQPPPPTAVDKLRAVLDLEPVEVNLFRGVSPDDGWQRVYGGQVLGQALVAATRTLDEPRNVHSLHAYFLLAGDPNAPIVYAVERTRDGGSFATRRVQAIQHGHSIFTMAASYHKVEEGFEHQAPMPDVPPPEELPSADMLITQLIDKLPQAMRGYWMKERPIEMRPVDMSRFMSRTRQKPVQHIWLRTTAPLPDDVRLHQAILAYASDFTLLDTALIAHGKLLFDTDLQLASLDHALWFHGPFRIDEWVLYSQDSPFAGGARGLCRGSFFTRDGRLFASSAQEGLIRRRPTAFVVK